MDKTIFVDDTYIFLCSHRSVNVKRHMTVPFVKTDNVSLCLFTDSRQEELFYLWEIGFHSRTLLFINQWSLHKRHKAGVWTHASFNSIGLFLLRLWKIWIRFYSHTLRSANISVTRYLLSWYLKERHRSGVWIHAFSDIHIYQPLPSSRIWHSVNF